MEFPTRNHGSLSENRVPHSIHWLSIVFPKRNYQLGAVLPHVQRRPTIILLV